MAGGQRCCQVKVIMEFVCTNTTHETRMNPPAAQKGGPDAWTAIAGPYHTQTSHAPIPRKSVAATLMVHRRRAMRSLPSPLIGRSKAWTFMRCRSRTTGTATHTLMLRLIHGRPEVLRTTVRGAKLLRARSAMLAKTGRCAALATESALMTWAAKLLRPLLTTKPPAKSAPHPAPAAMMPMTMTLAALRRAKAAPATG